MKTPLAAPRVSRLASRISHFRAPIQLIMQARMVKNWLPLKCETLGANLKSPSSDQSRGPSKPQRAEAGRVEEAQSQADWRLESIRQMDG